MYSSRNNKTKRSLLYILLQKIIGFFFWRGRLAGRENIPPDTPVVFFANHSLSKGPIAIITSLPIRVRALIISHMTDRKLCPGWVRMDFIERELKLKPPVSVWLSRVLARIIIPFFKYLKAIPVYKEGKKIMCTLDLCLDALGKGYSLLVFPEKMNPKNNGLHIDEFQRGFVKIAAMYFKKFKKELYFCPIAVHSNPRVIQIGKPLPVHGRDNTRQSRKEIAQHLQLKVEEMLSAGYENS